MIHLRRDGQGDMQANCRRRYRRKVGRDVNDSSDRRAPPWRYIDPGILELVRELWRAGLTPFASCQGGEGHPFPWPTVLLKSTPQNDRRVAARARRLLLRLGIQRCTIARVERHRSKSTAPETFVQVEVPSPRHVSGRLRARDTKR